MKYPLLILAMFSAFIVSGCGGEEKQASVETRPAAPHAASPQQPDKNVAELESRLRAAVATHPESAVEHARLAGFLLTHNKTAEAIPAFQDAITLDPENPKLFAAISIAYLHQGKFNMAKAMADQALRLKPDMQQVKKINEYIAMKQQVMQQAQKADEDNSPIKPSVAEAGSHGG